MTTKREWLSCVAVLISAAIASMSSTLVAQSRPTTTTPTSQPADDEKLSVTQHSIALDGKPLAYRATAGTLAMKDGDGKSIANIFFVAYDTPAGDLSRRPITFIYNGGPGAAAVWLHLGGIGPKAIVLDEAGLPVGPPYKLSDNPATWLRASDLVFIDPVSTGFSRPTTGQSPDQFHGYRNDIKSVGEFIRVYMTKFSRWQSPIYLAGESYGTTRSAGLVGYLADRYGVAVSGITLISSVLDFAQLTPGDSNDLPYEVYLPTYAAVAWHHKKLSPTYQADLTKTLDAAREFVAKEYTPALLQGAGLPADQRAAIVQKLSDFTSLPAALIERNNLRIGPDLFEKELFGDGHKIIGRFDGRVTGYDPEAGRNGPTFDPSLSYYLPAYSSTFNQYVRDELHYSSELPYETLANVQPWPLGDDHSNSLYNIDELQNALLQNPHLRVEFFSGLDDLATPFYAADYTINRMNLSPDARSHVTHVYFPAGHMIYHDHPSALEMAKTVETFVAPTTQP